MGRRYPPLANLDRNCVKYLRYLFGKVCIKDRKNIPQGAAGVVFFKY